MADPWATPQTARPGKGQGPQVGVPPALDLSSPAPTVGAQYPPQAPSTPYRRGVAQVGVSKPQTAWPSDRTRSEQTAGVDERASTRRWPGTGDRTGSTPRAPMRDQVRQLRQGGEWSSIGVLFAFVCWGIWAISGRGGDLTGPVLAFFLVLVIAAGVFALSRLLGRVVLERSLGRVRRSAWGSHMATGVFLVAAGIAYLGQKEWVVSAWTWVKSLFW